MEILRCVSECRLLTKPLNNDKYVNAKLITWNNDVRTGFRDTCRNPEDIRSCYATGILKIAPYIIICSYEALSPRG